MTLTCNISHVIAAILLSLLSLCASGADLAQNEPYQFQAGVTLNTETINCPPHVSGFKLSGAGRGALNNKWNTGHATYIVRGGGSTEPMVRMTGADHTLSDFALYGQDIGKPTGILPRVGVLMAYEPGVGTGSSVIERLNIQHCVTAIQFGDKQADLMCDTTTVRNCTLGNCDCGVRNVAGQAMNNAVENVEFTDIRKAAIRVDGGGNLTFSNNCVTEVRPGEKAAYLSFAYPGQYLGDSNWNYTDIGFKADRACGDRLEYVHFDGPGAVGLVSINPQYGAYEQGRKLYLQAGNRVKIIGGSRLLTKGSIYVEPWKAGPKYDPPEVFAEMHDQCCEPKDMVAPGSAPVRLRLLSCYKPIGEGVQRRFDYHKVVGSAK